jgi:hypothetical protein
MKHRHGDRVAARSRTTLVVRREGGPVDDDPDFFRARCPLTGVKAKHVPHFVLFAERYCGGEIVPLAGAPLGVSDPEVERSRFELLVAEASPRPALEATMSSG